MNQMEELKGIVDKFMNEEDFTLRNAFAYAGIGLSKTVGSINGIIGGIGFSGNAYDDERKRFMAEHLGEMLFYWHVLASTTGVAFEDIIAQYIHSYRVTNNLKVDEQVNITELMKHVKPEARPSKAKEDAEQKKKWRDKLLFSKER